MGKSDISKIENDVLLLSTEAMQKAFGVTRQALSKWEGNGCPKYDRGWWDINAVIEWKIDTELGTIKKELEMTDKERKLYYEAELKKEQSESAGYKNAIMRGDYVEKKQVVQELSRFFTTFKQAALGLPRKVATEIAHLVSAEQSREVEALLNDVITDVLKAYSGGIFDD